VPSPLAFGRIERKVLDAGGGAWSHKAHVALQDVPKGGELVEAGGAEEAAEGGETLGVGQEVAARPCLVASIMVLNLTRVKTSPLESLGEAVGRTPGEPIAYRTTDS
jgi:hypothetical protein